MQNVLTQIKEVFEYVENAFLKVSPFLAGLWMGIAYIIFPDNTYIGAAAALGGAMALDILTKYYALAKPFKSAWKAIKAGAINSETFFRGTKKKLISFLVLMILCGLSVRVVPVEGIAIWLGTFVYSVMFLRECQSAIENLIQAGHEDLSWLLPLLKRKEKDILDSVKRNKENK